MSDDAYHKRKIGGHVLKPETQMMGFGQEPTLSAAAHAGHRHGTMVETGP